MNEERSRILKMLAEGKITTAEAEELLDALAQNTPAGEGQGDTPNEPRKRAKDAKYMYVKVESTSGDNVDVKVPLGLVRAGMKLTSLIPPQAMDHINSQMKEKGISFDLNSIKKEDIDDLVENLMDMEVKVKGKSGEDVRVYCA